MEQETEKKETKVLDKLKEETDKSMKRVLEQGVQTNNVDFLYKMIDIKKDIAKIEKEEQEMMYGNYGRGSYGEYSEGGNYSGGRRRDSRGRYMERGGSDRGGNYRGQEMLDDMYQNYGEYSENREEYGRGNYNAKGDTLKSLEYMLESVVDFMEMLKQDASSKEEVDMIKKYSKKISEM
jgi:hypothetical protein